MNSHSSKSSVNIIPSLFRWHLDSGNRLPVFDFGAGKKGKLDDACIAAETPYLPYDPFNRSEEENKLALTILNSKGCAYVASSNVLNIVEDEHLDDVISEIAEFAEKTWTNCAWISVFYKPQKAKNRKVRGYVQRNEPPDWYIPHLEKHFEKVEKFQNFLVCRN